jgi:hypothetical protein
MDIWSLTLWSFGRTSRGLLYVLIWEALLSNFVSGARLLSVSHPPLPLRRRGTQHLGEIPAAHDPFRGLPWPHPLESRRPPHGCSAGSGCGR